MLGFANLVPLVFLIFYYNFVKCGLFATKFCTHNATDNMNECCKFVDCMISTFWCVHILSLNHKSRKQKSYSNLICNICSRCLWHYVHNIL